MAVETFVKTFVNTTETPTLSILRRFSESGEFRRVPVLTGVGGCGQARSVDAELLSRKAV